MFLNFDFLGNCHNFALALNELTDLPLCLLYGERELESIDPQTGRLDKTTQTVLIHVGVIWSGCFYDENGNQGDPGALMRGFKYHNPEYTFTKIFETDSPNSEFYRILARTFVQRDDDLIEEFKEKILSQKGKGKFHFLDDE